MKDWTKGHLSAAKKSMKEGVEISLADNEYHWKEYFDVYQDSLKRWGKSASNKYQWKLFLFLLQVPSINCKLWIAKYASKIISGCICFYHNNHVVYWHGSSLANYFYLKPVHLLQYHIIRHASECGFYWYDFNPSG